MRTTKIKEKQPPGKRPRGRPVGLRKMPDGTWVYKDDIPKYLENKARMRKAAQDAGEEPRDDELAAIELEESAAPKPRLCIKRIVQSGKGRLTKHEIPLVTVASAFKDLPCIVEDAAYVLPDAEFQALVDLCIKNQFLQKCFNEDLEAREYWCLIDAVSLHPKLIFTKTKYPMDVGMVDILGIVDILINGRPSEDVVHSCTGIACMIPVKHLGNTKEQYVKAKVKNPKCQYCFESLIPAVPDNKSLQKFVLVACGEFKTHAVLDLSNQPIKVSPEPQADEYDRDSGSDVDFDPEDAPDNDPDEGTAMDLPSRKMPAYMRDSPEDGFWDPFIDKVAHRRPLQDEDLYYLGTHLDRQDYESLSDGAFRRSNHQLGDDGGFENFDDID